MGPGDDLGPRFHIEALIGEGGMGRVYKAYDRDVGRIVALKVLQPELTRDPGAAQRFKQELLLASKVSHRSVLRIHDLGEADGVKFISMAYVEGADLHELLHKEGKLPVERAVGIARQLCEALDAAHSEGVVHRDLKPQNILVDRKDHIYVSDFGLAKSLEASAMGMTRTGAILGTPRYMAPEQVEGLAADHRSDLYALGLICYEMLTGDIPFPGQSSTQVMFRRLREKPRNPKAVNPDIPDYLARIILRCLETDPNQRYQSAKEILDDLVAARASSASRQLQIPLPTLSRRAWLLGGAGVALVLAVVLGVPQIRHRLFSKAPTNVTTAAAIPPLSSGKFVAVLPFRIVGDPATFGYLADGLTEALSAKLFQMSGVRVASGALTGKTNLGEPLQKLARDLGANLIVQGLIQGEGQRIRVIVNLDDVPGSRRMWSQEFSGTLSDLLTLEDHIYAQLVSALDLNPGNDELARAETHPTENIEAYDLYLRGRNALRNQQQVKSVEAAIDYFNQALKKDSGFALAYAGLADASLLMYREKKEPFWAQKALAAAEQGQALNDKLPEVHFSLGSVYSSTGKTTEAIVQFNRALQLSPNSDEGYRRLGAAYLSTGKKEQAIQAYQQAVKINPYYWVNVNAMGVAHFQLGDYPEALSSFQRVSELEPDNAWGYLNTGAVYFQQGKYDQCIPMFQKVLAIQPDFDAYSNLGTAYFFLKRYAEAVQMYEKAVEMNPNQEQVMGNLADAYRWSQQKAEAEATYDKAIALAYKELQVNPRDADTLGNLALYYAKKGDPRQGLVFIGRARAIDKSNVNLIYYQAEVQTLAGQQAKAIQTLRTAFEKGFPPAQVEVDPELANLQSQPGFEKLLNDYRKKSN